MTAQHILRSMALIILVSGLMACQQEAQTNASAPEKPSADQATPTSSEPATPSTKTARKSASNSGSCILAAGWDERVPFHYRAPDGSAFGVDIDILSSVAERAGCALRYRHVPQNQQSESIETGSIDLLVGVYEGMNQQAGLVISDAYRTQTYDLHVVSASPVHRDDLEMLIKLNYDLGLNKLYQYEEPISALRGDLLHKSQFIIADSSSQNVDNLLNGEVDGILEDPMVVRAIADRSLIEGRVEHLEINAGTQDVFLQFNESKVSADVIERFNQAIAKMKQNGEIEQIIERHS
ncbi:MAG: transporter substrate-binding domain-containing protein [Xanthomonadales bacterium]|nr:transporter substrate-binding domain-containing protein [Xanthomonadales bacterium]